MSFELTLWIFERKMDFMREKRGKNDGYFVTDVWFYFMDFMTAQRSKSDGYFAVNVGFCFMDFRTVQWSEDYGYFAVDFILINGAKAMDISLSNFFLW